ncbi:hypothetical protein T4C_12118 [Trichinella pseudospiralis]|uniref:Uncharacterized protein n=2 Tax=Trichinella pseudospiralis TaxID=6337 RepID=A0A0V1JMF8_TRIPS|nr:hypothetical protein T4C_12118 [Trichinella pseudospiralis]
MATRYRIDRCPFFGALGTNKSHVVNEQESHLHGPGNTISHALHQQKTVGQRSLNSLRFSQGAHHPKLFWNGSLTSLACNKVRKVENAMKNTNTRNFDDRRAKRNTPLHGRNSFIKSHRFKSEVSLAAQLVTTRGPARERGAALGRVKEGTRGAVTQIRVPRDMVPVSLSQIHAFCDHSYPSQAAESPETGVHGSCCGREIGWFRTGHAEAVHPMPNVLGSQCGRDSMGTDIKDPEADGSSFVETLSGNGQPHELAKPWDDHGNNSKGYIGRLAQDESHGCRKEECASGRSTLAMIMDQVPTDSFHAGKYEDIELFRITLTDRGESH